VPKVVSIVVVIIPPNDRGSVVLCIGSGFIIVVTVWTLKAVTIMWMCFMTVKKVLTSLTSSFSPRVEYFC
jgi:hypothetical protein